MTKTCYCLLQHTCLLVLHTTNTNIKWNNSSLATQRLFYFCFAKYMFYVLNTMMKVRLTFVVSYKNKLISHNFLKSAITLCILTYFKYIFIFAE